MSPPASGMGCRDSKVQERPMALGPEILRIISERQAVTGSIYAMGSYNYVMNITTFQGCCQNLSFCDLNLGTEYHDAPFPNRPRPCS
jgi:hypothetical protein